MQPTTFKRLGKAGAYPLVKVGREYHAPRADVDAWLARQPTAANTPRAREDTAPAMERSAEELLKLNRTEGTAAKPARGPRRR